MLTCDRWFQSVPVGVVLPLCFVALWMTSCPGFTGQRCINDTCAACVARTIRRSISRDGENRFNETNYCRLSVRLILTSYHRYCLWYSEIWFIFCQLLFEVLSIVYECRHPIHAKLFFRLPLTHLMPFLILISWKTGDHTHKQFIQNSNHICCHWWLTLKSFHITVS